MRLVDLAANIVTEQGAETDAVTAQKMLGSSPGGLGSRANKITLMHFGSGATHTRHGTLKKHPTLSELKRWLRSHGKPRGILGLLGRDP